MADHLKAAKDALRAATHEMGADDAMVAMLEGIGHALVAIAERLPQAPAVKAVTLGAFLRQLSLDPERAPVTCLKLRRSKYGPEALLKRPDSSEPRWVPLPSQVDIDAWEWSYYA